MENGRASKPTASLLKRHSIGCSVGIASGPWARRHPLVDKVAAGIAFDFVRRRQVQRGSRAFLGRDALHRDEPSHHPTVGAIARGKLLEAHARMQ